VDELTELARAAQRGDSAALAALVRRTQADVWRLCRYLGDDAAADDLTQETYARALAALPRYRGESPVRTWLLSIARRVAADDVRRSRRQRRPGPPPPPTAPDPVEARALAELVLRLGPDRRAAFVLTQVLGLTYAEAAAACEVPVGTIRSRVARARESLVEQLHDRAAE
jgi:RNA polymerase sigma-70 factor (ECF subfamily)